MTTEDTVAEKVIAALADYFSINIAEIKPESTLAGDLQLDSLDTLEAVMALEDDFEIDILDEDVEHAKTVADVIAAVKKSMQGAPA